MNSYRVKNSDGNSVDVHLTSRELEVVRSMSSLVSGVMLNGNYVM